MTVPVVVPSRLSKSSLVSLICGILGCVPFVTGVLAVLLGLVGFVRTGKPGVRGRWMAVVGVVLGVLSMGGWTVGGLTFWGVWSLTAGPRDASHAFLQHLADGEVKAAADASAGIDADALQNVADYMAKQGKYEGATFTSQNRRNSFATMEGKITFSSGKQKVKMELVESGGTWKVNSVNISP